MSRSDGPDEFRVQSDALERISDGVVALNRNLEYAYVSGRAEELLDRDAEALLGEHICDVFPEAEGAEVQACVEQAIETGEVVSFERHDAERERWFEGEVYPDEAGVSIVFRDVTERRAREERLERANSQLEALLENSSEAIYIKDTEGNYRLLNETAAELFGLDVAGAVDAERELSDAESAAEIRAVDERILETGTPVSEESVRYIDGEKHVFHDNKYPYRDGDGDLVGVMCISRDITDREAREDQIRRLHAATRDLIGAATPGEVAQVISDAVVEIIGLPANGVHLHDEDAGGLVPAAVTDAARDIVGDPPVLDSGAGWEAFRDGTLRVYDDITETEQTYNPETEVRSEMHLPLGDHGLLIVSSSEVGVFDDSDIALVNLLASNAESVLDQLRSEAQLRETRDTLEAIVESSPDAIVTIDEGRTVTRWNPSAEELFGWSEEEALGREVPFVPAERTDEFETLKKRLDDGETLRGIETVRERKDGERIDVSLSLARIGDEEDHAGYMGTFHDISQRKQYRRRLEEQRDNLELLNSIMSHDIRNDLQVVTGYLEVLKSHVDDDGEKYVERVLGSAESAIELTQTARDLAEAMLQTGHGREAVPLRSVLQTQVAETRATYDAASVTVEGAIPRAAVLADDMLSSVFRNLLKNAIQHNDDAVPEVAVSVEVDPETVTVRVADNGPGVPDEQKQSVFGRGEKGLDSEGTGIGLYLVQTLIDQYDGRVWVEDNDPEGAVFAIELERA